MAEAKPTGGGIARLIAALSHRLKRDAGERHWVRAVMGPLWNRGGKRQRKERRNAKVGWKAKRRARNRRRNRIARLSRRRNRA